MVEKKKTTKRIPAKAGAKATTKSGDKVEVVLKTTKVVKDRRRGKYKPRKKTNKKQDATKQQKDALSVLREQIELEKLQALQRQQAQVFQPSQRLPNRRTSGDINQFFDKSRNDGTKSAVSDLQKEIKSLREEIKKKDDKPVEKPKEEEEKSKFKQELETTQNEIQRQRIQRGIARRDEEQRLKNLNRQIEDAEKQQKTEQSRLRVATRKLRDEKTARRQAQQSKFLDNEEEFKLQESLTRAKRKDLQKEIRRQPNTRPTVRDASGNILGLKLTEKSIPKPTPVPEPEPVPQPEPVPKAIKKESDKNKKKIAKDIVGDILGGAEKRIEERDKPKRFVVGGAGGTEVPFSSQEELLQAYRNRPNQPKPLPRRQEDKSVEEVSRDIVNTLDNQPLLVQERNRARRPLFLDEPASREKIFQQETDEDDLEDPADLTDTDDEQFKSPRPEPFSPRTQRRQEFLQKTKSPQVEEQVKEQIKKEQRQKLDLERQKLKDLQEAGDKAYADRLQTELQIQEDERVARDLLLERQRKEDFDRDTKKLDDEMRRLKEKKQAEKRKARDNLRKREQEEFLDETAGEIIREAVEKNIGERAEKREQASRTLVGNVFKNVVGGRALANEIATATQNIPRAQSGRYSNVKIEEKVGDLIYDDRTGKVERLAYSVEDAKTSMETKRFITNLKEKLALLFPKYFKQADFKPKQSLEKSKATIKQIIENAKSDGELTGLQLVKLETLLNNLAEAINEVVIIENRYRGRRNLTEDQRETLEQRQSRIRQQERIGGGEVAQLIEEEDEPLNIRRRDDE